MMRTSSLLLVVLATVAPACGDNDDAGTPDATPNTPDAAAPDASPDGPPTPDVGACPRAPAPGDRARFLVISHPFGEPPTENDPPPDSDQFEVFAVSTTGAITRPGITFEMDYTSYGNVVFTPDGEYGFVASENGNVGMFRLAADGTPTVIHAAFDGSFYANRVVMDPNGNKVWVIDSNTRENGGGIYRLDIGCNGELTDRGLVAPARSPGGLRFVPGAWPLAVVSARDVLDSSTSVNDTFLVSLVETGAVVASVDSFGIDGASIGGAAMSADGSLYFVGDVNAFDGLTNNIAVVGVTPTGLRSVSRVPVADPEAIAVHPEGGVALYTDAIGDEGIYILDDNGEGGTWQVRGTLDYENGNPQLPGDLTTITTGPLAGHVFTSELQTIRHIAPGADTYTDVASLFLGEDYSDINGAIGIQP